VTLKGLIILLQIFTVTKKTGSRTGWRNP